MLITNNIISKYKHFLQKEISNSVMTDDISLSDSNLIRLWKSFFSILSNQQFSFQTKYSFEVFIHRCLCLQSFRPLTSVPVSPVRGHRVRIVVVQLDNPWHPHQNPSVHRCLHWSIRNHYQQCVNLFHHPWPIEQNERHRVKIWIIQLLQ